MQYTRQGCSSRPRLFRCKPRALWIYVFVWQHAKYCILPREFRRVRVPSANRAAVSRLGPSALGEKWFCTQSYIQIKSTATTLEDSYRMLHTLLVVHRLFIRRCPTISETIWCPSMKINTAYSLGRAKNACMCSCVCVRGRTIRGLGAPWAVRLFCAFVDHLRCSHARRVFFSRRKHVQDHPVSHGWVSDKVSWILILVRHW